MAKLLVLLLALIPFSVISQTLPVEYELNEYPVSVGGPIVEYTGGKIIVLGYNYDGSVIYLVDPVTKQKTLVKSFGPGNTFLSANSYRVAIKDSLNPRLFFVLNSSEFGTELWFTDGTSEGTVMTKDLSPGSSGTNIVGLTAVGDNVVFGAGIDSDTEFGYSDGTTDGTGVYSINANGPSSPYFFTPYLDSGADKVVFTAMDDIFNPNIYTFDFITSPQLRELSPGSTTSPKCLQYIEGKGFFIYGYVQGAWGLYLSTDLTAGNTSLVKSFPGAVLSIGCGQANGNLIFFANDNIIGTELWKSDGTTVGTELILDINSGSGSTSFTTINQNLTDDNYFFFKTGSFNVWSTDGTTANTIQISDSDNRIAFDDNDLITQIGSKYYFKYLTPASGTELGVFNPLTEAVSVLLEINPGASSASISVPVSNSDNTKIYFIATDADSTDLFESNGTALGTSFNSNFNIEGSAGGSPDQFKGVGDKIYFDASNIDGTGVWSISNYASAPELIKILDPNQVYTTVLGFTQLKKSIYFYGAEPATGSELWTSKGTSATTKILFENEVGTLGLSPTQLTVLGNKIIFAGFESTSGAELWQSNGTAAGTSLLKEFNPGITGSQLGNFNVLGNKIIFTANFPGQGMELGITDGTTAGSSILKDINPGSASSNPASFKFFNNKLYFNADDGVGNSELWVTDGTAAGTIKLSEINPGSSGSNPNLLTAFKGKLYFTAETSANGKELWTTDGTTAGTTLFKDINPGALGSSIIELAIFNKKLYFMADNGVSGRELWQSDGTAAGTALIDDLTPGSEGTYYVDIQNVGELLLLHVFFPDTGFVLLSYDKNLQRNLFYTPSSGISFSGLGSMYYYRGRMLAATPLESSGVELLSYLSIDGEALGKVDSVISKIKKMKLKKTAKALPKIFKGYLKAKKFINKNKKRLSIPKIKRLKKAFINAESAFESLKLLAVAKNKKVLVKALTNINKLIDWDQLSLQK